MPRAPGFSVGTLACSDRFFRMDMILAFITSVGGLILLGLVVAFAIGWLILARRAKKISEIT
jgi:NhaP-type Na+/H+ or K+/H+ antiporter